MHKHSISSRERFFGKGTSPKVSLPQFKSKGALFALLKLTGSKTPPSLSLMEQGRPDQHALKLCIFQR